MPPVHRCLWKHTLLREIFHDLGRFDVATIRRANFFRSLHEPAADFPLLQEVKRHPANKAGLYFLQRCPMLPRPINHRTAAEKSFALEVNEQSGDAPPE